MPLCFSIVLWALLASRADAAPRAAYATADELEPEGTPHLLELSVFGAYAHVAEPERAGVGDIGWFALGSRLLVGRRTPYCVGFDGSVGGSDAGLAYGATAYLAGLGARFGDAGRVALCGGAGFDGVAGAVPFAGRFPVELSLAFDAGPVRIAPWARAAWIGGDQSRQDGVSWLSAVDEVEAGVSIRFARQRRYWSTASAGGGVALGLFYREFMDTSSIGLALGLDMTGAE
jgi:hypothetical protein